MSNEEWKAWAQSLKPGDKVVVRRYGYPEVEVVRKITPAAWIRTNKALYSPSNNDSGAYFERGGFAMLEPANSESLKEAEEHEKQLRTEMKREDTIRRAKKMMGFLSMSRFGYDFAERFLKFCEENEKSMKDTCLCPYCGKDLMGIPYGERMVSQCPECGQYLDATKVITREESEAALRRGQK